MAFWQEGNDGGWKDPSTAEQSTFAGNVLLGDVFGVLVYNRLFSTSSSDMDWTLIVTCHGMLDHRDIEQYFGMRLCSPILRSRSLKKISANPQITVLTQTAGAQGTRRGIQSGKQFFRVLRCGCFTDKTTVVRRSITPFILEAILDAHTLWTPVEEQDL
jgi:hypothetical protein